MGAFDTDSALLVIRFPRDRIECCLRNEIRVVLRKVKRHEDLPGSDNLRQPQRNVVNTVSSRHDIHTVMRSQAEAIRVGRIDLEPRVWRKAIEDGYIRRLRPRMPVLNCATCIKHERKLIVRLIRKRMARNTEELRPAVLMLEDAVFVQALYARSGPFGERPLQSPVLLDQLIGHSRVVAKTAFRNSAPFVECIAGRSPVCVQPVRTTESLCDPQEDVEIR